jgi:N-acetylmuramoyl-L-alanine amidase
VAASIAEQIKSLQSPLIKAVRVGNPAQGVTRVVIELIGAPRYSTFSMYGPFRVVVDLESTATPEPAATPTPTPAAPPKTTPSPTVTPAPAGSPKPTQTAPPKAAPGSSPSPTPSPSSTPSPMPAASSPSPSPTPTATPAPKSNEPQPIAPASNGRGDYSLARQLGLRVAKIVIDPGHGGHDPGAIANGVTESELVLDVALRLEKLLLQVPGVEVVLTRRTNEFVPLEERTAIANREKADLFLSIHANSHSQPAVRGIESYFLNFATNPDAEAVAARENAASVERMGTLPAIVKAITLNSKLEESRDLAAALQGCLMKGLSSQPGGSRDLGVKQAPFVVLIGAQMPSVLTEIGFLTNKTDSGLFQSSAARQQIAQSLRDAIVRYQSSLKKVSSAGTEARRE